MANSTTNTTSTFVRTWSPGATTSGLIRLSLLGPYELNHETVSTPACSVDDEGAPRNGYAQIHG